MQFGLIVELQAEKLRVESFLVNARANWCSMRCGIQGYLPGVLNF